MKASAAFEQQVRRIYELIAESGAEVTWNDHIGDPDNPPRTRQIDVTLRRNGALTLVECRLRKAPQDVQWIECLIGRRISLGAQSVIAVSSSGFTSGALTKARQYGIITRDLQRLTDKEVESWGQRIELTLYYYQYSDLEVFLGFSPESIPTIKFDEMKAELRWHRCVQSLFNAAGKKLTDANLMSGPLQGQKVNFGVDIGFDDVPLGGAQLERAAVPRQNSIRMELNPRVTLLHPQAILGGTGRLRFGKLLIRKVPRERGVLTRDTMIFRLLGTWPSQSVNSPITRLHSPISAPERYPYRLISIGYEL